MLFLRLAGPGEGAEVTRRRVPLDRSSGLPDPGVRAVVEPLRGRAAAERCGGHGRGRARVAVHALAAAADVAGRGRRDAAVQRRLAIAAAEWDGQDRDPTLLWQGTRLSAGRDAADTHPEAITVARARVPGRRIGAGRRRNDARAEERAATGGSAGAPAPVLVGGIVLLLVAATVVGVLAVRRSDALSRRPRRRTRAGSPRNRSTEQHLDLGRCPRSRPCGPSRGPRHTARCSTLLTRSPRIVTEVHADGRFLRAGVNAVGSTVLLAENGPNGTRSTR